MIVVATPLVEESSEVKPKFQGKCKFCNVFGCKQADCFKFKSWLEKKKRETQNEENAK